MASETAPTGENDWYFWDVAAGVIDRLYHEVAEEPSDGAPSARLQAALYFALRVRNRTKALTLLFQSGLYGEAVPLVRAAYEDWVSIAHMLVGEVGSDERAVKFRDDGVKTQARAFQSLGELVGEEARDEIFASAHDGVREMAKLPPKELHVQHNYADWAAEVGLSKVHRFAYSSLSELSHGNILNYWYVFEDQKDSTGARDSARDAAVENQFAWWVWWFHHRTLSIAADERGVKLAVQSERLDDFVETCKKHMPWQSSCMVVEHKVERNPESRTKSRRKRP